MDGVILLNKPTGMTSFDAVRRVRRIFHEKKAGHTGTLDPEAGGLMIILLGRYTKMLPYCAANNKTYHATFELGRASDTEDAWGTVIEEREPAAHTADELSDAAKKMTGKIMQVPPMYSAIRVGGRRLMEIARAGGEVEREARPITVYSIEAERLSPTVYALDVHCSKGTYIRTLCADIGRALGVGGCMQALTRTEAAGYPLSRAYTLDELASMSEEARATVIIPTEDIFSAWPAVTLSDFYARLAHNGQPIYLRKIGRQDPLGTRVTFYDKNGFFAIAEVEDTEDGPAARPIRQF